MSKAIKVGDKFHRLTVTGESSKRDSTRCRFWFVACDCGKTVEIRTSALGVSVSCGCFAAEVAAAASKSRVTHGHARKMANTSTYKSWASMLNRCYQKKSRSYKAYGGAGISVCDRWIHSFENFLSDMGERPDGCSIDRINGELGYEPTNCKWSTRAEQCRNRKSNILISIGGVGKCAADWADQLGVKRSAVYARLRRGVHPAQAFSTSSLRGC